MKKLIILLLALLICLPALAETLPAGETAAESAASAPQAEPAPTADPLALLAPFTFTLPEDVVLQHAPDAASVTFMHLNGSTRVVAQVISRVPDVEGDHAAELERLMKLFSPGAEDAVSLPLAPGFHGLQAVAPYVLEGAGTERVDLVTTMVLWQTSRQGELLILSAYDMAGETARAKMMISMLLSQAAVDGQWLAQPAAQEPADLPEPTE